MFWGWMKHPFLTRQFRPSVTYPESRSLQAMYVRGPLEPGPPEEHGPNLDAHATTGVATPLKRFTVHIGPYKAMVATPSSIVQVGSVSTPFGVCAENILRGRGKALKLHSHLKLSITIKVSSPRQMAVASGHWSQIHYSPIAHTLLKQ